MMDLTPLDVRKKKGDFRRGIRGYEAAQVDDFLDLVADRMEALVRQASSATERIARLEQQVADYRDREKALTEALVTAQQMREDIRTQSTREVELLKKQAEQEAERIRADAVRLRDREESALEGLRARQFQFMSSYRRYLEQELAELGASIQGLEMHVGSGIESGVTASRRGSKFAPPPAAGAAPATRSAEAPASAASPTPAAPPVSPPAPTAPSATRASPVAAREPRRAPAPTVGPVAGPSAAAKPDESEAPLDDALARWEPGLRPAPGRAAAPATEVAPKKPAVADVEDDAVLETRADGEAGAVERDRDEDLVLSADDVVDPSTSTAGEPESSADKDGAGEDLEFLDFGEDDIAEEADEAAVFRAELDREFKVEREREVRAALVERDEDLIDLESVLGPDEGAAPRPPAPAPGGPNIRRGAPASPAAGSAAVPPERDETDEMIDAAFDFGDDDGAGFTLGGDGASAPAGEAAGAEGAKDRPVRDAARELEEDIEFVDALLLDAETAFNEEPSDLEEPPDGGKAHGGSPRATDDVTREVGAAFDAIEGEGQESEDGANLIDLDSFRGFSNQQPPPSQGPDVTSLTLHPIFFEKDSEPESEEQEESRHDHW